MNRRQFFKLCASSTATSAITALGLMPSEALAAVREFKLLRAKETRNNCCYCSVGCGLLMYSHGSNGKNAEKSIFHIEGDADHPVNRGSLCPKGAGLVDYVNRLMKEDRDANLIEKNSDGTTVNRWLSTGMMTSSAQPNEGAFITHKFARSLGLVAIDTIARN